MTLVFAGAMAILCAVAGTVCILLLKSDFTADAVMGTLIVGFISMGLGTSMIVLAREL